MARVVLVHGALNELWGPNELKARWLPALRDGLWHCGVTISDDDVAVCFYGDLFRRAPGTASERRLEQSRAGVAEALSDLAGGEAIAALGQAASDAAFERTVDMVTIMATVPEVREQMRIRAERVVGDEAAAVPLGERFGPRVEEVLIDNGHRSHAPEPYLNAAATGTAIAAALA